MRLTNSDRQAFIRSVMDDVPEKDYDKEKCDYIMECAVKHLPKELAEVINAGLSDALGTAWVVSNKDVYLGSFNIGKKVTLNAPQSKKVERLKRLIRQQAEERARLKSKIGNLIGSVNTLKRAKEVLPKELHKYLPADRSGTGVSNLPAIAGVVGELKKHGWPTERTA